MNNPHAGEMMEEEENKRIKAVVDGRVQGVGFRYFVYEHAVRLGLTGWVRNTYTDQVILIAEGPASRLDTLLSKIRVGPRSSFVSKVSVDWQDASGEFSRFQIAATR